MGDNGRTARRRDGTATERRRDAERWLGSRETPANLVDAYARRYGVGEAEATRKLMEMGYRDTLTIQGYERAGIAWEYRYEALSGEMVPVPVGTEEWEMFPY